MPDEQPDLPIIEAGAMQLEAQLAFHAALGTVEDVTKTEIADTGKYCLAPWTQVLTADLRWVDAKELEAGDELAAFDEYPQEGHAGRRWCRATVLATKPVSLPAYRITLDDDTTLTASGDHRWLTRPPHQSARWVHTDGLRLGQRLIRLADTWNHGRTYEHGYLAGLYDGEGSLHQSPVNERRTGTHLSFGQNAGRVLDAALGMLDELGFQYTVNETQACHSVRLRGGRAEMLRFLGSVRPKRLLDQLDYDRLGRLHPITQPAVIGLEFLGPQELIATATSTETLIAEGIASHNTYRYATLPAVLDEVKRACEMHGLAMTQVPTAREFASGALLELHTRLLHKNGGVVDFDPIMLPLPREAQAFGSALTYVRRYSLLTIFGIATEDDDGAAATVAAQTQPGRRTEAERMIRESMGTMNEAMRSTFIADFKSAFGGALTDLPANRHGDALTWSRAWIEGYEPPVTPAEADDRAAERDDEATPEPTDP